jgi:hypothetical protein
MCHSAITYARMEPYLISEGDGFGMGMHYFNISQINVNQEYSDGMK